MSRKPEKEDGSERYMHTSEIFPALPLPSASIYQERKESIATTRQGGLSEEKTDPANSILSESIIANQKRFAICLFEGFHS
jgi:hypothetical protein